MHEPEAYGPTGPGSSTQINRKPEAYGLSGPGSSREGISSLKLIDLRDLRARRRDTTRLSALTGPESSRDVYRLAQTAHCCDRLAVAKIGRCAGQLSDHSIFKCLDTKQWTLHLLTGILDTLPAVSLPGQEGARPPALWQAEAVGRPLRLMPQTSPEGSEMIRSLKLLSQQLPEGPEVTRLLKLLPQPSLEGSE